MKEELFDHFRNNFPAYQEGIYMNHAAVSPFSTITRHSFEHYWQKRALLPVDIYPEIMEVKSAFKQMLAHMINCRSDRIAITASTSHGLNIIASGFPFKAGDRIILNTMEFPANIYPFTHLERKGVNIDWIKPEKGKIHPDQIENLITDRTRMVAISFVQFLNGFRADLEAIGQLCHARNIAFIVDGIQGAGVCSVDVKKCHIDGFSAGGQKWLMWPMGIGFLYISKMLDDMLTPSYAGWLSVKDSWNLFDYNLDFLDTAEKHEIGTLNYLGLQLAHDMMHHFVQLGIANIHQKIMSVTDILFEGFDFLGLETISSRAIEERSGIVSVKVPDPEKTAEHLKEKSIYIAVREGVVRFSPHCTNTEDEAEKVIRVLKKIL